MTTQIFKDYEEFLNIEDKTVNGVTQEFLDKHGNEYDYVQDNETNNGCFNCHRCTHCIECEFCMRCDTCEGCRDCEYCDKATNGIAICNPKPPINPFTQFTKDSNNIHEVDSSEFTIKYLDHYKGLHEPLYATDKASGFDIMAAIYESIIIQPLERRLVPSGLTFMIPDGKEVQIRPRSGLALKYGITVLNAPGTIDADYRGEVMVLLINLSNKPFMISRGMRIAQCVYADVLRAKLNNNETEPRNTDGFGSTGLY